MKKLILASASPRRKELLQQIGLKFKVEPSEYDEQLNINMDPRDPPQYLSHEKACTVAARHKNAIIIAADTVGVLDGKIIGKPRDSQGARDMLSNLSGKMHLVITGFTILDADTGKTVTRSVETKVWIKKLSPEEIDAYVKTGEPLDKAGAYAIQGLGAVIVEKIEGDYHNVIGLPLFAVTESLKAFGVKVI